MIKFYGEPNHPVTILKKVYGNRKRNMLVFTFDDKGTYTMDESKVTEETLKRLKRAFKWSEIEEIKTEVKKDKKPVEKKKKTTKKAKTSKKEVK